MKSVRCLALLLVLAPAAMYAQGTDITVWASWLQLEEQSIPDPDFEVELEWESDIGFGASANWFWGDHLSTELAAFALESEAVVNLSFPGGVDDDEFEFVLGSVDITPIMLTAQWHFNTDGVVDPFIGIGAAYVMIDDLETFIEGESFTTEFDDEIAVFGNIGVGFSFTPNFGATIDARYIPLEPETRELDEFGNTGESQKIKLNPLMLSAGLRWRFGGR